MRLYLDACCLNRPFDDQTQNRIRLESEAVLLILDRIETGEWSGIGSAVLSYEIAQIPDLERRQRVELLMRPLGTLIRIEQMDIERAQDLETLGFRDFDALHLACAERGAADIFLTTDDQMRRLAARVAGRLRVRVENPLTWLQEVTQP